jgi:hypothetical protein
MLQNYTNYHTVNTLEKCDNFASFYGAWSRFLSMTCIKWGSENTSGHSLLFKYLHLA